MRTHFNLGLILSLSLLCPQLLAKSQGPGLGNDSYKKSDMGTGIARITENTPNGPPVRPSNAPKKHWGMNTGSMINGYFMAPFAYDSGNPGGGLLIYDLSNMKKPKLVNRLYDERTDDFREIHSMGYSNIGKKKYLVMQSHKGIHIWNVSDVKKPLLTGKVDFLRGGDYSDTPWQLAYQHPYIYVTGANTGLWIIDATDLSQPKVADRQGQPNPIPLSQLGGFRVGPIWAMGNRLVLTSMDNKGGISQLDISDPLNPELKSSIGNVPKHYYSSSFNGETLTMFNRRDAYATFYDLTSPDKIQLSHEIKSIKEDQLYGASQDNFTFIGAHYQTIKIDMGKKKSSTPKVTQHFRYPKGVDSSDEVTVLGNVLFLGSDHGPTSYFVPHQQGPDKKSPKIRNTSPVNKAKKQDTRSRIAVAFTDNIDLDSVNTKNFSVQPIIAGKPGKRVKGVFSAYWNIVNFTPSKPLKPNTQYQVRVKKNGLKDWAANSVKKSYSFTFKTSSKAHFAKGSKAQELRLRLNSKKTSLVGDKATIKLRKLDFDNVKYKWDFGDGSEKKETKKGQVSHLYDKVGRYQVTVVAETGNDRDVLSFTHTVHHPLSPKKPVKSNQLVFVNNTVISANPDNHSITAVRYVKKKGLVKVWESRTDRHPRTLALSPNKTLWVANKDSATISIHSLTTGRMLKRIRLPRSSQPFGIIFSPDHSAAFVSLEGIGEVMKLSLMGKILDSVKLGPRPRGLAMTGDSQRLLVSRFISADAQAEVYEVDPLAMSLRKTFALPTDTKSRDDSFMSRGVANYLNSITINPDGRSAWIPSKKDNILRGHHLDGKTPTFETSVRPIVSEIKLIDKEAVLGEQILDLNDRAMPSNIAFTNAGDIAFITTEGSNTIEIVDAFTKTTLGNIFVKGLVPRGLVLNKSNSKLYVQNFMSRTLECFDVRAIRDGIDYSTKRLGTIKLVAKEKLNSQVLLGKQVFYNAADARMSRDAYISCAICHDDGGHDGRTWDFTDRGEGMRNTPTLRGRSAMGHGAVHWSANFDEIQDFENDMRGPFAGTGFMKDKDFHQGTTSQTLGDRKTGKSKHLDAMAAYVRSLNKVPSSPYRIKGKLSESAQRGYQTFLEKGCYSCHGGTQATDSRVNPFYLNDVGTLSKASGKRLGGDLLGLDTPSLKGLWSTAPYLHDGSAKTLKDVFVTRNEKKIHGNLSDLGEDQLSDLESFLLSLDERNSYLLKPDQMKKALALTQPSSEEKTELIKYQDSAYIFEVAQEEILFSEIKVQEQQGGQWKDLDKTLFTRRLQQGKLTYEYKTEQKKFKLRYTISPLN